MTAKNTIHDYRCQECGKVATVNLQQNWHKYEIDNIGDFTETQTWEGDTNEFYCSKCYEKTI